MADEAARLWEARVVALASPVSSRLPHVTSDARHWLIGQAFGLLAEEQLSCGFHVHVEVSSREEGIEVLDRIRVWFPVLLAMSSNSPFWYGRDSGFASYRHLSWGRWPTAGVMDVFGSVGEYEDRAEALIRAGAAMDRAMLYFPARLSERFSTVEVRIMDVCLDARHAAALATLVRALVENAVRQWRDGILPHQVSGPELGAWMWRAARHGLTGNLVDPASGDLRPAAEVVAQLMAEVGPVLVDTGDQRQVAKVVELILAEGTGAVRQRQAYVETQDLRDVIDAALRVTHAESPPDEPTSVDLLPLTA